MTTKKVCQQIFFIPLFCCCIWIRDPAWVKIRIRDKHPRSATLLFYLIVRNWVVIKETTWEIFLCVKWVLSASPAGPVPRSSEDPVEKKVTKYYSVLFIDCYRVFVIEWPLSLSDIWESETAKTRNIHKQHYIITSKRIIEIYWTCSTFTVLLFPEVANFVSALLI